MKMKKDYENAEINIIDFKLCDVITTSNPDPEGEDTDWGGGQGRP